MGNLKEITSVESSVIFKDVEHLITDKEIPFTKQGKWLKMKCILPFGHNDSKPSFFIHSEHGGYNCYVCGSGNWNELCKIMNWNYSVQTIQINTVPEYLWDDTKNKITNFNFVNKKGAENKKPKGLIKISPDDHRCKRHWQYLVSRKIEDLTETFDMFYTLSSDPVYANHYQNRIIIPCHDDDGKLEWYEGRTILKNKNASRYFRPYGVKKTNFLFNYHNARKNSSVIVVEGIIDAMILHHMGISAVCSFGSMIDESQISKLMVFDTVYICLDNDPAGIKGWSGMKQDDIVKPGVKQKLLLTGVKLYRMLLPKNKDINDFVDQKDKIYNFINRSKLISN